MNEDNIEILSDENPNRVEEYFKTKEVLRTLKDDLKELKENNDDVKKLKEMDKEIKPLKERIKNNEDMKIINNKIAGLKERMDLLKEIIKKELMETSQEEVKMDGRKLKLVQVLKEMKDEDV